MAVSGIATKLVANTQEFTEGIDKATRKARGFTNKLQQQAETFDLTSRQAKVYRLRQEGASSETVQAAAATSDYLDELERQRQLQRRAAKAIERTETATDKFQREQRELNELLEEGQIDLKQYKRSVREASKRLGVAATKAGAFGKAIRGVGGRAGRAGGGMLRLAKAAGRALGPIAKIGGAIGLGGTAFAAIKAATNLEQFNRSLRKSQSIMDVTGKEMKAMRDAALDTAERTVFAGREMGQAFFFLASAGLDAKQSIKALPQVAQFAQAGMFDLQTATDLATDAQVAMGLASEDAQKNLRNLTRVTDVLVGANQLATTTVEQMSKALTNKAAAAARNVDQSIEETVATLAVFASQGFKGEKGGRALEITMRRLDEAVSKAPEAWKELGIQVFDATGDFRSMADIIEDLEKATKGMSDETRTATLRQLGFSARARIFVKILLGMSDKMRENTEALKNMGGETRAVAEKQMTPLQRRMEELKATFLRVSQAMQPLLNALAGGAEEVTNFLDNLDPAKIRRFTKSMVVTVARAVGQIADFFTGLAAKMIGAFEGIVDTIRNMITSLGGRAASMLFGIPQEDINAAIVGLQEAQTNAAMMRREMEQSADLSEKFAEKTKEALAGTAFRGAMKRLEGLRDNLSRASDAQDRLAIQKKIVSQATIALDAAKRREDISVDAAKRKLALERVALMRMREQTAEASKQKEEQQKAAGAAGGAPGAGGGVRTGVEQINLARVAIGGGPGKQKTPVKADPEEIAIQKEIRNILAEIRGGVPAVVS